MAANAVATHMKGTSCPCPSNPTNRYSSGALWPGTLL